MKTTSYLLIVFFLTLTVSAQYHKEYYFNGRISEEGMLKNGKKQGEWKSYSPHDFLNTITTYEKGIKEGLEIGYHENGKLSSTQTFRNGEVVGESKAYYDDGKTLESYSNYDTGETKNYYWDGHLKETGIKLNYNKTGEWKSYYQNGKLSTIENYIDGNLNGEWKRYHDNGQLIEIGNYQSGNKIGEWKFYYKNGKISAIGKYENNSGVGPWKTYNEKGENDYCDCPPITSYDVSLLCRDLYERKPSSEESELAFKYQQALWRMSCAKEGVDDMETARKKIQCMWNKYRELFSCDYPGMTVPGGNITMFSLEANFPEFLRDAVKDYKLDMNFKDPKDDRTILDFVRDKIIQMKKAPVNMTPKIQEYERLYKMLQDHGAKHGKDL